MDKKIKLILDANAFILQQDLQNLAQKYELVTCYDIIDEIKDIKSREKLEQQEHLISFVQPSDSSIKKVKSFATKTGDIASLSEVDMILIALAVTFIEKQSQTHLLRKEPVELTQEINHTYEKMMNLDEESEEEEVKDEYDEDGFKIIKSKTQLKKEKQDRKLQKQQQKLQEFQQKQQEKLEKQQQEKQQQEKQQQEKQQNEKQQNEKQQNEKQNEKKEEDENKEESEYESDSDDGKGWINETNMTKVLNQAVTQEQDENIFGVTIMTSDFAIQNVVIQMGIQLLATDGMVIKKSKRFVLECYACYRICKNVKARFCPTCGNNSLLKLSCSLNADGTFKFYRKKGHRVRTTGNIYSIPQPTGGRKNNDLILREDEFLMHGRDIKIRQMEKQKDQQYQKAQIEFENGMGFQRKRKGNEDNLQIGHGRKNINDRFGFKK